MDLPRQAVADFLESIDPAISARFVEYLITEKGDGSTLFHNRLAELYLRMTQAAKKHGDNGRANTFKIKTRAHTSMIVETRQAMKAKFLLFIDTTSHYEVDRLFGLLPSDGEWYNGFPRLY